jgi:hypothetical protein
VQNLIDIYKDNWDYIIYQELRAQVSEETLNKYKWLITKELNILKRVVKDLSLVYKKPPERKAVIPMDEQAENEDGEQEGVETTEERTDENYDKSQENTVKDFVLQNINQYTNLVNHTLLKVNYRDGKLDYEQLNFNNAEIYTDPEDWMRIIAVKYYYGYTFPGRTDYGCAGTSITEPFFKLADNEGIALNPVQTYSYAKLWVAEDIDLNKTEGIIENEDINELKGGFVYHIKPIGEVETIIDTETTPIPYKKTVTETNEQGQDIEKEVFVLPFVLTSLHYPVDFLLDFTTGNDLRDLNVNVAIMMIWINTLAKYQSFKQIVFNTDDPDKIPDGMKTGPADIMVNPTREGDGSVQVLDLQTRILDVFQLVKERIQTTLAGYGISPENFSMSASPQSGFALKISNMGKLEAREAQVQAYNVFEKKLFDIERVVWNYHRPKEKIADNAELMVDFVEPTFPLSQKEKTETANFGLAHNIITDIDLVMKHNPDLTREQATEEYLKNKAFNEANQQQPVQMQPVRQPGQFGGNNAT